jgi:hypothetical protein
MRALETRSTSNSLALLGFLGPTAEGQQQQQQQPPAAPLPTMAETPPAADAASVARATAPAAAAASAEASQPQQPPPPASTPAPPPVPPIASDLSRRAVPLGSGASARGTGMLARSHTPAKLGAPSSSSSAAAADGSLAAPSAKSLHLDVGGGGSGQPPATERTPATPKRHHHHHHHHHHQPNPPQTRSRAIGDVLIGDPNSSVTVPSAAARLYVDMNADEIGEEARAATRGARVVHPLDPRYRAWWTATIAAALATGWIEPFRIAFLETHSQGIEASPRLWLNALSIAILALFCTDVVASFFVGYYDDDGILVMRHGPVARHYLT